MPRKARINAAGELQHIIICGIEHKAIFKDATDRGNFLDRLGTIVSESQTDYYAWVLMNNHVHLLLKTGLMPVATVMRRLLMGYAVSFNRRHRRHGQLFQNRYKSFLCEEDLEQKYRLQETGPDLEQLLNTVAQYYEIDPEDLKTASKESTITKARTVLCYLAVRKLMISCADVARTSRISPATVSRATSRGPELLNLEKIQKDLMEN
jgi:REP element-mobilizing transposase RayT